MNNVLLSLDLSTTNTGYAVFNCKTKALQSYGEIKPNKIKNLAKLKGFVAALEKMRSIATQINELIKQIKPEFIIIEEITQGISRLGQKTLNGLHYVILDKLPQSELEKVIYVDVIEWRRILGIRLSEQDKIQNKQNKAFNKKAGKKGTKLIIWNAKHKAEQFVNKKFKLNFNVSKKSTDSDICDAICLGYSYMKGLE
jgi:Holliday junction resolvasome RuvABC endonuclease subunit